MHLDTIELVFVILVVATALAYLARRIGIAEPILFLLGGIALGFVPDLPEIELSPDVVFLVFVPPILFAAAYLTPIRDFKANLRPILLLAIGLVVFTTVAVAVVIGWLVPAMTWPVAIALGAIVAPTDAVTATAVLQRLGVPRRLVTILEGESLVNDATSLTIYRTAIEAVRIGSVSLLVAGASFVLIGFGGIAVGVLVGLVVTRGMERTGDPILEIILSFIAPISAYVAAELLGVSGVLAVVVAGLITGRRAARVLSPDGRLMGEGAWNIVIWAINAFVFILIGLQLPGIIRSLDEYTGLQLLGLGLAISLTVIVARLVWVYPATYLPRILSAKLRARDPAPPRQAVFIIGWAGMRGVVSLAAALALPTDFPQRDLILFLTFCVIVATLVGQGLSLPWLVDRLGVRVGAAGAAESEEVHARLAAVEAALVRLDELAVEYPGHIPLIDQLKSQYDHEAEHVWPNTSGPRDDAELELLEHRNIRNAVLTAQRESVIKLRDDGIINDSTLRSIERDLDLEALRTGA
jgi:CPA1 family monovalent cation:H+ antiporter